MSRATVRIGFGALITTALLSIPASAFADPVAASTTTTTPTTTTLPPVQAPGGSSSPGLFDISGHVQQAINDWFASLITSAVTPVLTLLGRALLSAPDLTGQSDVRSVWDVTLGVADALFGVFAVIGAVVVMTHETVQARYSLKEIAPRLVLAVITANVSLVLISQSITLANATALGLLGGTDAQTAVSSLSKSLLDSVNGGVFLLLLAVGATAMAIVLVCIALVRAVLVVVLIVAAPLALACHALPQTDQIASIWWRALAACLSIQVAQALVLVTAMRVLFATGGSQLLADSGASSLLDLLLVLCVFWVMIKIPAWAERLVFTRGSGPVSNLHQKAWVAAKLAVMAA